MKKCREIKGISSLIMILIISAVALLIASTAAMSGINEAKDGLHQMFSKVTLAAAEGCAERALLELNHDSGYPGETLSINNVSCTITVSGSGDTRTIQVTGTHPNSYTRQLRIDVSFSGDYQITDWQEINT